MSGCSGPENLLTNRQGVLEQRPSHRKVALAFEQAARSFRLIAVSGCSGPSAFSYIASARS